VQPHWPQVWVSSGKNLFLPNWRFKPVKMVKTKMLVLWDDTKNSYLLQQLFII